MNQKAKKVLEKLDNEKMFTMFLIFGQKRPWIRIRNPESEIRIRIKIKPWIRIRIKAYANPKHWSGGLQLAQSLWYHIAINHIHLPLPSSMP